MKRNGILNSDISRVLSYMGTPTESVSETADFQSRMKQNGSIWL